MSFLPDTNVVSEWVKPRPDARVVAWLGDVVEDRVFIRVVPVGELRPGLDRLPVSRRRERLDEWLRDELPHRFEGRVLSIDTAAADVWGAIVARRERRGRPIGTMDAFVAATATVHDLTLVTRNTADFESSVKTVFNPWTEEA